MKTFAEFKNFIKEKKDSFEMKKSASLCGFSIFDSVDFIPEQVWHEVIPSERGLMRLPYLKAAENSKHPEDEFRYVIVYKDKKPVAAIVFHIFSLDASDYRTAPKEKIKLSKTIKQAVSDVKKKIKVRVLLCGNAHLSGDHGFYYLASLNKEEAYHALADACYRVRRAEKLRGPIQLQLIKDFYDSEVQPSQHLKLFGYKPFEIDPNMSLKRKNDWDNYDDYLNNMKSKYLKKVKNLEKKGKELKLISLTKEEIIQNSPRILELYEKVAAKAKFRIISITPSYFVELKHELAKDFQFIAYMLDDKMVGFSTYILWGANIEGHTIGLDYDYNSKYSIYQNILNDVVKAMFEHKKDKLILGRTAMEIKSNIGATPDNMLCYIRHPKPLANRLIHPVFNYVKKSEWTLRNPFKE